MKVFVSSTVYDLIDVRAEIASELRALGISPIMSDDQLSDFHVKHSANSIQTCLVNVDSSDEIIIVLDQRYGPRLGVCGFEDISATHLEYKQAKGQKPIHMYVRDRLEADFRVWKANSGKPINLPWVSQEKDYGLFDLIKEHSALTASASNSNWYHTFTDSGDLKEMIRRKLGDRVLPTRIVELIARNEFPLFDIKQSLKEFPIESAIVTPMFTLTNEGGGPAFNFRGVWSDIPDTIHQRAIIPPRGTFIVHTVVNRTVVGMITKKLAVDYESPIGVKVSDEFEVRVTVGPYLTMLVGSQLISRHFTRTKPVVINLEE